MTSGRWERSRARSTACRPASNCTTYSGTTDTNRNWTNSFQIMPNSPLPSEERAAPEEGLGVRAMATTKQGGLAGVVAGETAICTVGKEGYGLTYRGYD